MSAGRVLTPAESEAARREAMRKVAAIFRRSLERQEAEARAAAEAERQDGAA